ncbi:MAG TPA: hypothetical protein VGL77_17250 [Armatimonadota bacterium]|jgi:hypothetical protein
MTKTSHSDTPVLRLIGWLLLLLGVTGVATATVALWQAARLWSSPDLLRMMPGFSGSHMGELLQKGMSGLYSLALIVVGLALLRRVRWARWAATAVLLFDIAWTLLDPLIHALIFWYPLYLSHLSELRYLLFGLLNVLPDVVMVLFLVPVDSGVGQGRALQRAAAAVQGYLTRSLPVVVAFIALYLLAHGLSQLSGIPNAVANLHLPATGGNPIRLLLVLNGILLLLPLVNSVAGLALLTRLRGGVGMALGALGFEVISMLIELAFMVTIIIGERILSPVFVITVLFAPVFLAANVLLAVYLLRYRAAA